MSYLPDSALKKSVKAATTASVTLAGSAPNTLDGVTLAANDRILVKNQATAAQNGIYIVQTLGTGANGTWVRSADADVASEIAGGFVNVDQGTVNGGLMFKTTFKTTDTLGTTGMTWYQVYTSNDSATANTANALVLRDGSGNFSAGTITATLSGNATSATTATNSTNAAITDDTSTNASMFLAWVTTASGNQAVKVSSTKLTFNPSTGVLTASGGFSGTATNATNTAITDDTATNSTMYPMFVAAASGNQPNKVSSTKLTYNPSTGTLSATTFSGALSGTATNATNIAITDDTSTNATMYPVWVTTASGNQAAKVSSSKMSFNPSTGTVTASNFNTAGTTTTGTTAYGSNATVTTGSASVTTTSTTTVDTWLATSYRSARYTVQIADGTSYETADMLIIHDGTTAYVTVFGNVFTSAFSLGNFDASIATGTLSVTYTATAATSKTVKFTRQLMTV
jgi:hypothetical protein